MPPNEPGPGPPAASFWTRHKTLINFWLDVFLAALFLVQAWLFIVLRYVFPRGDDARWTIFGGTADDWQDASFGVFCMFSLAVVVHVMLHWDWICATVSTRLLHRKSKKDDGTHTLIGVGLLVVLIHVLIGGILGARVGLSRVTETPPANHSKSTLRSQKARRIIESATAGTAREASSRSRGTSPTVSAR